MNGEATPLDEPREPFHVVLREAITARGLSLQRLHAHLAERQLSVGVATLSYWQRGARRPTRDESVLAVSALEEILQLPPRTLTSLLPPASTVGRPRRPAGFRGLVHQADALEEMVSSLGHETEFGTDAVVVAERLTVGTAGDVRQRRCLHVVRARREVDRQVVIHVGEDGCLVDEVQVQAHSGARVGRVRRDARHGLVVAELLFDRLLRVGETQVLEYDVADASGVRSEEFGRFTQRPIRELVLDITFETTRMPVRFYRFFQPSRTEPRDGRRELRPSQRSVHVVETDAEPGMYGICWEWE